MPYLVPLSLLGFALSWQRWQQSAFSSACLHSAAALLATLYAAALLGILPLTSIVLLTSGFVLLGWQLISNRQQFIGAAVSISILALLLTWHWLAHGEGSYLYYDEYSHWGVFLREMLATGGLWDASTNAMHPRYPPGPALWQYFFSAYTQETDGAAYFAQFTLFLIPLAVLWNKLTLRLAGWAIGILILLTWLVTNFGHGVASLYVDHILAAWFAGTVLNFVSEYRERTPTELLSYCLPLAVLPLLKDVGLLLALQAALILAGLFALKLYDTRRINMGSLALRSGFFTIVLCVGAVLVVNSWSANRNALDVEADLQSTGGIVNGILFGETMLNDNETAIIRDRFSEIVLHQQISKAELSRKFNEFDYEIMANYTDRFRLSTAGLLCICILLQLLTLKLFVTKADRRQWLITYAGINLAAVTYIVVLLLSYQFAFGEDGMRIPSYIRYVHSVLLPLVLITLAPLLPAFRSANQSRLSLPFNINAYTGTLVFGVVVAAAWIMERPFLEPLYKPSPPIAVRMQMHPVVEKIRSDNWDAKVWVYMPLPQHLDIYGRVARLELSPLPTTIEPDINFLSQPKSKIINSWAEYDYVWFPLEIEQVEQQRKTLLGENSQYRVFKVDKTAAGPVLIGIDLQPQR